jgi:hypothetical protein
MTVAHGFAQFQHIALLAASLVLVVLLIAQSLWG